MSDVLGSNVKESNRLRVLEVLLRHPSRSRADLGRSLGLSRATVTALLSELEQAGMVEQQPDGADRRAPQRDRPPAAAGLARPRRRATPSGWTSAIATSAPRSATSAGEIVAQTMGGAARSRTSRSASLDLAQRPRRRRARRGGGRDRRRDRRRRRARRAGRRAPRRRAHRRHPARVGRGIRPAEELEARLGMPVQVENDANAGAMGEHLFGAGRGVSDMLYLRLSAGVGLGLILARPAATGASRASRARSATSRPWRTA